MRTGYLAGLPYTTIEVNSLEIDVFIDTGFNGWLMLSSEIIKKLQLENIGPTEYVMADGDFRETDLFTAEIEWLGSKRQVAVVATPSDFSLIGMGLLYDTKMLLRPARDILIIEPED